MCFTVIGMTLKEAYEIGKKSGCRTVGEVILNIEIHATELFKSGNMIEELIELAEDARDLSDDVLMEEVIGCE